MSNSISTAIKITDGFSPALKGLHNALSIVTTSLMSAQKQFGKPIDTSSFTQAQTELAKVSMQFDQIAKETEQAKQAQDRYNQSLNQSSGMMGNLWGKVKGLIGAYATLEAGKFLINSADTYGMTLSRLDMMNDGLQTTAELEDMIRASANRTYSSFSATADAVGKLGINAKGAFNNTQDVVNFAEQINKHMAIAGTKGAQAEGAWLQLTQAMSNGVLRGDELQSVMDGMPTLVEAITKEFGERGVKGSIKQIAEQGLITAEVVKTALYKCADETNEKFQNMQTTFGDLWNLFKNYSDEALKPVFKKLNSISGSETARKIAMGLGVAVGLVAKGLLVVMNTIEGIFNFISTNMSWIQPLFMAVAGACLVWGAALAWVKLQALYTTVQTALLAVSQSIAQLATLGLSGAMAKLCAVMAINPMTLWIIAGVLLVGVFYVIIGVINKLTGTSISATGLIAGAFAWLGGAIVNVFVGVWNFIVHIVNSLISAFTKVGEFIYNAFNGGFTSWIDGAKNALWSFIDWALNLIKPLIKVWDKLKGTNYAETLQMKVDKKLASTKGANYKSFAQPNIDAGKLGYVDANAWAGTAYTKTKDVVDNFSLSDVIGKVLGDSKDELASLTAEQMLQNAKDSSKTADGYGGTLDDIAKSANDIAKSAGDTAKNTGATAKNAQSNYDEEMKFMRELGQREAINRFTTAQVKVMQNNSNNIASGVDADSIIARLTEGLREALAVASER